MTTVSLSHYLNNTFKIEVKCDGAFHYGFNNGKHTHKWACCCDRGIENITLNEVNLSEYYNRPSGTYVGD